MGEISLVGGVASNKFILNEISKKVKKNNINIIMPPKYMLSDNAAMIGWTCIQKYSSKVINDINFKVDPRLKIS